CCYADFGARALQHFCSDHVEGPAAAIGIRVQVTSMIAGIGYLDLETGGPEPRRVKRQNLLEVVSGSKVEAVAQLLAGLLGADVFDGRAGIVRHPSEAIRSFRRRRGGYKWLHRALRARLGMLGRLLILHDEHSER